MANGRRQKGWNNFKQGKSFDRKAKKKEQSNELKCFNVRRFWCIICQIHFISMLLILVPIALCLLYVQCSVAFNVIRNVVLIIYCQLAFASHSCIEIVKIREKEANVRQWKPMEKTTKSQYYVKRSTQNGKWNYERLIYN